MCVAPARASSYRSVAASVHTQLVELRIYRRRLMPNKHDAERRAIITELLTMARYHSPTVDGDLDHARYATPDGFSLAHDVADLIPARIAPYDTEPDVRGWIDQALRILTAADTAEQWNAMPCADIDFAERELEAFLENTITA